VNLNLGVVDGNWVSVFANSFIIDVNFSFVGGDYLAVDGLWVSVDGFRWRLFRFMVVFLGLG